MPQLLIKVSHWQAMQAHVEACMPLEACGLLAGHGEVVERVMPIRNEAESPTRFRMDPAEQIRAFNELDGQGLDLVGIFHSHPAEVTESASLSQPSATDVAEAAYPVVQIVWSRTNGAWRARGFWIQDGSVVESTLRMQDDEQVEPR
jgi:[CysO sulfur-carrier protein]-S-L-cysteine hydrolase